MRPLDANVEAAALLAAAAIFGMALLLVRIVRWCWRRAAYAALVIRATFFRRVRRKSISR